MADRQLKFLLDTVSGRAYTIEYQPTSKEDIMRIHTALTLEEVQQAFADCQSAGTVAQASRLEIKEHRSTKRDRAFEIKLCSHDASQPYAKRTRSNAYGVSYGADFEYSGTWQEHGFFFSRIWELDSSMTIPRIYEDRYDMDEKTLYIFEEYDVPLMQLTAADLEPGDIVTGWGRSSSGIAIVRSSTPEGKKKIVAQLDLYGGIYGFRYTTTETFRADRPVLVFRSGDEHDLAMRTAS